MLPSVKNRCGPPQNRPKTPQHQSPTNYRITQFEAPRERLPKPEWWQLLSCCASEQAVFACWRTPPVSTQPRDADRLLILRPSCKLLGNIEQPSYRNASYLLS